MSKINPELLTQNQTAINNNGTGVTAGQSASTKMPGSVFDAARETSAAAAPEAQNQYNTLLTQYCSENGCEPDEVLGILREKIAAGETLSAKEQQILELSAELEEVQTLSEQEPAPVTEPEIRTGRLISKDYKKTSEWRNKSADDKIKTAVAEYLTRHDENYRNITDPQEKEKYLNQQYNAFITRTYPDWNRKSFVQKDAAVNSVITMIEYLNATNTSIENYQNMNNSQIKTLMSEGEKALKDIDSGVKKTAESPQSVNNTENNRVSVPEEKNHSPHSDRTEVLPSSLDEIRAQKKEQLNGVQILAASEGKDYNTLSVEDKRAYLNKYNSMTVQDRQNIINSYKSTDPEGFERINSSSDNIIGQEEIATGARILSGLSHEEFNNLSVEERQTFIDKFNILPATEKEELLEQNERLKNMNLFQILAANEGKDYKTLTKDEKIDYVMKARSMSISERQQAISTYMQTHNKADFDNIRANSLETMERNHKYACAMVAENMTLEEFNNLSGAEKEIYVKKFEALPEEEQKRISQEVHEMHRRYAEDKRARQEYEKAIDDASVYVAAQLAGISVDAFKKLTPNEKAEWIKQVSELPLSRKCQIITKYFEINKESDGSVDESKRDQVVTNLIKSDVVTKLISEKGISRRDIKCEDVISYMKSHSEEYNADDIALMQKYYSNMDHISHSSGVEMTDEDKNSVLPDVPLTKEAIIENGCESGTVKEYIEKRLIVSLGDEYTKEDLIAGLSSISVNIDPELRPEFEAYVKSLAEGLTQDEIESILNPKHLLEVLTAQLGATISGSGVGVERRAKRIVGLDENSQVTPVVNAIIEMLPDDVAHGETIQKAFAVFASESKYTETVAKTNADRTKFTLDEATANTDYLTSKGVLPDENRQMFTKYTVKYAKEDEKVYWSEHLSKNGDVYVIRGLSEGSKYVSDPQARAQYNSHIEIAIQNYPPQERQQIIASMNNNDENVSYFSETSSSSSSANQSVSTYTANSYSAPSSQGAVRQTSTQMYTAGMSGFDASYTAFNSNIQMTSSGNTNPTVSLAASVSSTTPTLEEQKVELLSTLKGVIEHIEQTNIVVGSNGVVEDIANSDAVNQDEIQAIASEISDEMIEDAIANRYNITEKQAQSLKEAFLSGGVVAFYDMLGTIMGSGEQEKFIEHFAINSSPSSLYSFAQAHKNDTALIKRLLELSGNESLLGLLGLQETLAYYRDNNKLYKIDVTTLMKNFGYKETITAVSNSGSQEIIRQAIATVERGSDAFNELMSALNSTNAALVQSKTVVSEQPQNTETASLSDDIGIDEGMYGGGERPTLPNWKINKKDFRSYRA